MISRTRWIAASCLLVCGLVAWKATGLVDLELHGLTMTSPASPDTGSQIFISHRSSRSGLSMITVGTGPTESTPDMIGGDVGLWMMAIQPVLQATMNGQEHSALYLRVHSTSNGEPRLVSESLALDVDGPVADTNVIIATGTGIHIRNLGATGVVATRGILIDNQSGGNAYAIWADGGSVYFGGQLQLGSGGLSMADIPTSPSGLSSGRVWVDVANGYVLKVVP